MTNNNVNREENPLYLNLKVSFDNGSQPFEMLNDNSGVGWFASEKYLKNLPGVIKAEWFDTTSSAGDWCGWYAVKSQTDNTVEFVAFDQENNHPRSVGYTLWTNDRPFATVDDESIIDVDVVNALYSEVYCDY